MSTLKWTEIETKYRAEEITREDFDALVSSMNPLRSLTLSKDASCDYYFTAGSRFMRFRFSENEWELTSKTKTTDTNNKVRTEVNAKFMHGHMDAEKAEALARSVGLAPDFNITKAVQIYWFPKVVLSHYTTYDGAKKLDTFLEVEALEDYPWSSETEALDEIAIWEKKLAPLGINSFKRIRRSLFEMYTRSP